MRTLLPAVFVLAIAAPTLGQEPGSTPRPPAKNEKAEKAGTKIATLVGCVERGDVPNRFTLMDPQSGKYALSGARLSRYVGQRVQLVGTPDSSRLRISGGLLPTPNVAAQAGAIDPVQAAIAAAPGGPSAGTGEAELPRFKVKSVQTVSGGCR